MLGERQPIGFVPGCITIEEGTQCSYIVFCNGALLSPENKPWRLMGADEWRWSGLQAAQPPYCIGVWDGVPCMVVSVVEAPAADSGWSVLDMRAFLGVLDDADFSVIARARQVIEWLCTHAHCGVCGKPTAFHTEETALQCTSCGALFWPRITPCAIVLVTRGEEALLARNVNFPPEFFSTVAGFVEPGESVEQTAVREVEEETGVHCKDMSYYGSQAWPFPTQLMLGFHAVYESGEARPDNIEIAEVGWWRYSDLPRVPPPTSISGALIDAWVKRFKGDIQ